MLAVRIDRPARRWREGLLAASVLVALVAYLYGLGSPLIPSIGDEPLYLQIARVTGESGRLLPLVSETGITDTKPPLLFWQGMAMGALAGPDLFWLRLPSVLLTFATAALVGLLVLRLGGARTTATLAALLFLGFRSTIQHGRPFLTNPGETCFLFLPLVLLARRERTTAVPILACGASLGVAALYKSFAVIVPGTVALALVLLYRSRREPNAFPARHAPRLALAALLGLAVFGLWLALDPRPDVVVSQFVVGENAGKLQPARFLAGLLQGPWPIWRIWLGPILNAGLLAPVVIGLLVDAWRRRRDLPDAEVELWLYVLGFLAFYSLPTQRQENYLLPTSAALAALLALRWEALGTGWLRLALVPLSLAGAALLALQAALAHAAGEPLWGPVAWVLPVLLAGLAAAGAIRPALGRALLPALALLVLVVITSFLGPFSRPLAGDVIASLRGRVAVFPDRFQREPELYRWLAPGADVRGYPCGQAECRPPDDLTPGEVLAVLSPDAPPRPGYDLLASLPRLRSRQTGAEVAAIAGGDLRPLLERLVLYRRRAEDGT